VELVFFHALLVNAASSSTAILLEHHPPRQPATDLGASSLLACSLGLSATSQQYFSLRTNQPPATSQQYFSLRTNQRQPSATSQTTREI
jgi:hypothetical protein